MKSPGPGHTPRKTCGRACCPSDIVDIACRTSLSGRRAKKAPLLSVRLLPAAHRLTIPRDSREPWLQLLRMGGCPASHRRKYTGLMAPNSVGGVQTIIAQFFDRDKRAFTVWEFHSYFVS
jgi:hypothetical protein